MRRPSPGSQRPRDRGSGSAANAWLGPRVCPRRGLTTRVRRDLPSPGIAGGPNRLAIKQMGSGYARLRTPGNGWRAVRVLSASPERRSAVVTGAGGGNGRGRSPGAISGRAEARSCPPRSGLVQPVDSGVWCPRNEHVDNGVWCPRKRFRNRQKNGFHPSLDRPPRARHDRREWPRAADILPRTRTLETGCLRGPTGAERRWLSPPVLA